MVRLTAYAKSDKTLKGSLTVWALYAYFSDSQNAAFEFLVWCIEVSVQLVNPMARASWQNIFKIPTHSRVMAGRKGRGSEIS